jgi:hypothetical protein
LKKVGRCGRKVGGRKRNDRNKEDCWRSESKEKKKIGERIEEGKKKDGAWRKKVGGGIKQDGRRIKEGCDMEEEG